MTWRLEETTPREIDNRCRGALARRGDLADRERKLWLWQEAKDRATGHGQAGKDDVAVMHGDDGRARRKELRVQSELEKAAMGGARTEEVGR